MNASKPGPSKTKSKGSAKDKKKNSKKGGQNKQDTEESVVELPPIRFSNEQPKKDIGEYQNRQKVLMIASRGITHRDRHLLKNLLTMMPHAKSDTKCESKKALRMLKEMSLTNNCNKCIYFENRKRKDLYMWMGSLVNGPTVKFLVENVHTMEELRMTGNALKASRPFLSFDATFERDPAYALLRELFVQTFGIPKGHPKSQPFHDHVYTFTVLDNRIWFRNYQIVDETGSLAEIGPRFTLNVIKIFDGFFEGCVMYSNPHYVSPMAHRKLVKEEAANKYKDRQEAKKAKALTKEGISDVYADMDIHDDVFNNDTVAQQNEENNDEDNDNMEVSP